MTIAILIIGYIATLLAIVSYIPQSLKVIKNKSSEGLSLVTYTLILISCSTWMILSSLLSDIPAYVTNISIFILALPMVYFLLKNKIKFISVVLTLVAVISLSIIFFFIKPSALTSHLFKIIFTFITGIIGASIFIPQVMKTFKTKNVDNLSLTYITLVFINNSLWVIYWILRLVDKSNEWSFIITIVFTMIPTSLQIPLFIMKIRGMSGKTTQQL